MIEQLKETVSFLQGKGIINPEIGIILGTGLGKMIDEIDVEITINYTEIPHFPLATVEYHSGKLVYGMLGGKKVLAMQGRFHYYEGYTMQQVTLPIRVMKLLGINLLLISNACGAMNTAMKKGTLMVIDDHINLLGDNPLIGPNLDSLGSRFPDMSQPYSKEINEHMLKIAGDENISLHQGVYVAVAGPNLETRAEYRFLRVIGADVVGMSTVPEVIVANHMNLPCAAVSVITDECDPDHLAPVDIAEIVAVAGKAEKNLIRVFVRLIKEL